MDIWMVQYEFNSHDKCELPLIAQSDTLFQFKGTNIRNYTTSYSDTLSGENILRRDLKIYMESPSTKKSVLRVSSDALNSDFLTINDASFRRNQRDNRVILYSLLFGFFFATAIHFIQSLRKQPSAK